MVTPFRLLFFQPPSKAALFFGNSRREHFTQQNLILDSDDGEDGNNADAGFARNFTLVLDKAVTHRGRFATVQLHFSAKWIMVSEIGFATSKDAAAAADIGGDDEPDERIASPAPALPDNEQKAGRQMGEEKTHHVRANEPSSDARPVVLPEEEQKRSLSPNNGGQDEEEVDDDVASSVDSSSSSGYPSIVYVGLVIGVLSATVLLLLATILVMLRRNKQRVFIKQEQRRQEQMQQQMLGQQLGTGMMRQLTPMSFVKTPADFDAMTLASNSKLYEDAALISGAVEDIYHEPSYPRLVLQRPLQGPSTFRWTPLQKADVQCRREAAKQLFNLLSLSETAAAVVSATTTSLCTSSDSRNSSTPWRRPPAPRPS